MSFIMQVGGIDLPPPPPTPARTALQWEQAALGGGSAAEAWLEVTYLDYDMRITRGSGGDLFVLTRADAGGAE